MKTLEEIGVSPAPWACAKNDMGEYVGVTNVRGFYAVRFAYDIPKEDASLIAAAPELYDALREFYEYFSFAYGACTDRDKDVLEKARAALAKAGGEEVE